jgi:hypothetical protein
MGAETNYSSLSRCSNPACQPVEQIRGAMGPGDYKDVEINNGPDFKQPGPIHKTVDHYKFVEITDANRDDFRICCMICGVATAWGPKDFPNMPDAGADYTRKTWNRLWQSTST